MRLEDKVNACIKFDTTYMVRQELNLMIADSLKGMDGNFKITLHPLPVQARRKQVEGKRVT